MPSPHNLVGFLVVGYSIGGLHSNVMVSMVLICVLVNGSISWSCNLVELFVRINISSSG